jgi:flagellar biosynthesis protein FlhF
MRIRRFEAPDSKAALAMVKAEMGEDAVILANRTIPATGGSIRKYGRTLVEVVAAMDYDLYSLSGYTDPQETEKQQLAVAGHMASGEGRSAGGSSGGDNTTGQDGKPYQSRSIPSTGLRDHTLPTTISIGGGDAIPHSPSENSPAPDRETQEKNLGKAFPALGDDNMKTKSCSRPKARPEDVIRWREQLIGQIRYDPIRMEKNGNEPRIVAMVGATGVGKTTTAAKLAAWAALHEGLQVALISMDCYRIGATDQLRTYARIMRIPCEIVLRRQDLPRAVNRHSDCDLIIIDTAGKSPYDDGHVTELGKWFSTISAIEPFLAVSATTKREDLSAVLEGYGPLSIKGLILTKLDETRAYAVLCQQIVASGRPVSCLCTGQRVPEDFLPASDEAVGKLFREGWLPFVRAYSDRGRYRSMLAAFH